VGIWHRKMRTGRPGQQWQMPDFPDSSNKSTKIIFCRKAGEHHAKADDGGSDDRNNPMDAVAAVHPYNSSPNGSTTAPKS